MALISSYLGVGTHAARPTSPSVQSGETAFYYETDTTNTFVWTGSAWVQVNGGGGGLLSAYINIQDQEVQGTDGGTFTAGAWQTRALNTKQADAGSNATLSSNQIVLAAGTYDCRISCPAYYVNYHQARLYNSTGAAVVLWGSSEVSYAAGSNAYTTRSIISGEFTIAASQSLVVQHQCQTTKTGNGFGSNANFGTEVYTIAEFWKH